MELLNNMMTQSKEGHKELMETLKKQNSHKEPSQQSFRPRRRMDPEIVKKLRGHCSLHVRDGICRRKDCTYLHADKVPEEIRNLLKNWLPINEQPKPNLDPKKSNARLESDNSLPCISPKSQINSCPNGNIISPKLKYVNCLINGQNVFVMLALQN